MKDEELIRHCLRLAQEAKDLGDGAYGALITDETGNIIARAGNTTNSENSVTYHAEINAIQQAEYNRGKGKLKGCTLYSSAEPCPMCASAIVWSGIEKVVFGASISALKNFGVQQIDIESRDILTKADHKIEVKGPVLEQEALQLFGQ
ncbi:MAG: nucleoside deaminase [Gracilimonas sp.]|uniref:nucleoside deaminase n=1 Tax=Gracilimonas TaxID=649462 RepID=UPI001B201F97|nr:nucleoside deaminase [Gracilimonas sp.]MBO6585615.1 nucleoside deaminase [Gracilimonas sp.]MBO6616612.1 nucleoside deaminase [Gracilimonas sp.]